MGASFHALLPMQRMLLSAGVPALALETQELLALYAALPRRDVLLVAVSQSGRGAEMVRLMRELPPNCPCAAVTNEPGSPLAQRAQWTVELRAGRENSVSCKTWINTLAALDWLCRRLLELSTGSLTSEWSLVGSWMRGYLAGCESHVAELAAELRGISHVTVVGRGDSLAAAGTGG